MSLSIVFFSVLLSTIKSDCTSSQVSVMITACNEFEYFGSYNSLSMQVQGKNAESNWFIINQEDTLPSDGNSQEYCIDEDLSSVGSFSWVNIQAFQSEAMCVKELSVSYSSQDYTFGRNYFGDGIFLVDSCDYSFRWLSDNYPLLQCFDKIFTLKTYESRTIYDFDIHTCLRPDSSVSVNTLTDKAQFGLMVQNNDNTAWIDAGKWNLDHFMPNTNNGGYNGKKIGDLVATDYVDSDVVNNDFLIPKDGNVVALRISLREGDYFYHYEIDSTTGLVTIEHRDGESAQEIGIVYNLDSDRYYLFGNAVCLEYLTQNSCTDLLLFVPVTVRDWAGSTSDYLTNNFMSVSRGETARIGSPLSTSSNALFSKADIYLVYLGNEDLYQIPYVRYDLPDDQSDAFDADDACLEQYGTHLASIHNIYSFFFASMYCRYSEMCLIGAYQMSQNGDDDGYWRWTDDTGKFQSNDIPYNGFWDDGEPNDSGNKEDCVQIRTPESHPNAFIYTPYWNDIPCNSNDYQAAICNSPYWYADQTRTFQFNIDQKFDEIVLMSITNTGTDPFCIDNIQGNRINDDHTDSPAAVKIGPSNWVGVSNGENICSTVDCSTSIYAMFDLPVCQINIIDTQIEDFEYGETSYDETVGTFAKCTNQNRFIDTTCEISQSVEVTEEKFFEVSHSTSTADETSWSVGLGVEVTFNFGAPLVSNFPWATVAFSANYEYSSSKVTTTEDTRAEGFSSSKTKTIDCSASVDIPPNHEMSYGFTIRQQTITLDTLNTLELILCSAFLTNDQDDNNNAISEESGDIIYQQNVPGQTYAVTASVCEVTFNTLDRIESGLILPCGEVQALAIRDGATYMPLCQENNSDYWDGCQCETGDKLTEAPCYCVDQIDGSIIPGTAIFSENDDWRDTCRELACENSIYQPS